MSKRHAILVAASALLLAQAPHRANTSSSPPSCTAADQYGAPHETGTLRDPALTEASGLAASRVHRDVFYAHNDSGDTPRFFAIDASGARRGEFRLEHATSVDWEDIAVGPCGNATCVYLADIGDNNAHRASLAIYRTPEPALPALPGAAITLASESLAFTYPDGPHDAEAAAVDPSTGAIYVFTKSLRHARVYRLDASAWTSRRAVATFVRDIDVRGGIVPFATGADIHPCAPRVLIRTYTSVLEFRAVAGSGIEAALASTPIEQPSALEFQSEAIAYRADGMGYLTVAEGAGAAIHEVRDAP